MKRPGLIHGILVAALLSLAAPVLYRITAVIVSPPLASKLVLAMLVCGYVLYLLRVNRARMGNVVLGAGTALVLTGALLWGITHTALVFVGTAVIWAVRSLLAYSSVLMGLVDGALCLLGLGVAASVFGTTGGVFWAIWCFFLIQSLFTLIPERPGKSRSEPDPEETRIHTFSEAHANAEAALRELARQTPLR